MAECEALVRWGNDAVINPFSAHSCYSRCTCLSISPANVVKHTPLPPFQQEFSVVEDKGIKAIGNANWSKCAVGHMYRE